MARKRMLHPTFFKSEKMAKLCLRARLTFAGLWIYADDEGRGLDDPRLIKGEVWPQDDDITLEDIAEDLTALSVLGLIRRYEKRGVKCFVITSWREYQAISHKTKSKLPRPPAVSRKSPEQLAMLSEEPPPNVVKSSSVVEKSSLGLGHGDPQSRVSHELQTPNGNLERLGDTPEVQRVLRMRQRAR